MSESIKYRVLAWINPKTRKPFFGIQVKHPGDKWFLPTKNDNGPLFFDSEAEAKAKIKQLKETS